MVSEYSIDISGVNGYMPTEPELLEKELVAKGLFDPKFIYVAFDPSLVERVKVEGIPLDGREGLAPDDCCHFDASAEPMFGQLQTSAEAGINLVRLMELKSDYGLTGMFAVYDSQRLNHDLSTDTYSFADKAAKKQAMKAVVQVSLKPSFWLVD
ncbi:hypothetical protein HN587_01140 [Candidatus Woesearchaeota archaeon]|jgi:hypothetical protein|nr:hypothetical protein [Candidatus Woesearchaeota archaeon]